MNDPTISVVVPQKRVHQSSEPRVLERWLILFILPFSGLVISLQCDRTIR